MKRWSGFLLGAALGVLALGARSADASVVLNADVFNDAFFSNVENWLDLDGSQTISTGDLFYGILHVQNVDAPITIWSEDNVPAGGLDTFTGYFLTSVTGVGVHGLTTHISLGVAAADPNGSFPPRILPRAWSCSCIPIP